MSVSYTHLDVYKRQEEILDLMQEKEVPDSVELKPEIINRSSVTVSYTHLVDQ